MGAGIVDAVADAVVGRDHAGIHVGLGGDLAGELRDVGT